MKNCSLYDSGGDLSWNSPISFFTEFCLTTKNSNNEMPDTYNWFWFLLQFQLFAQNDTGPEFRGQLIGWTNLNIEKPLKNQWGIRYIPSFSGLTTLNQKWRLDAEASVNAWGSALMRKANDGTAEHQALPFLAQAKHYPV